MRWKPSISSINCHYAVKTPSKLFKSLQPIEQVHASTEIWDSFEWKWTGNHGFCMFLHQHFGGFRQKKSVESSPGTFEVHDKWVLTFTCLGSQEFATKAPRSRRAHRDGHHSKHHGPGRHGTWHVAEVIWAIQSAPLGKTKNNITWQFWKR